MKNSRRKFLKNAGTGILALGVTSSLRAGNLITEVKETAAEKEDLFKIAMAGYTFVKFKLEPALDMIEKVGVHYLCIKDFHLPLNSTVEQIAEFHSKLKAKGVTGYAVGPIGMKTEADADKAFEYCKRVGVTKVIGVPEFALLPYIEKLVKKYDFLFAIHNHGPGDKLYPSLESIYLKVKDLDSRIGMCHDIGYSALLGLDPVAETFKYSSRIHDMHIKDETRSSADGDDCELGRGVVDFPALVKALRKTRYKGMCSLEFEKDNTDPLVGIAESIGYFKGVVSAV
jgi:inosose dehydratase